ncbi:MAG: class I SAM-dependent methyltransferase [Tannerellaceae bacterium]|nr:class I SAM-dependent methyltransferase [Tannerellaceae bacterium]
MKHFIGEHAEDDLNRLLLSASRYPGIDVPYAVGQIACRRQIRDKLPSWYANDALVFPAGLAAEQCSPEQTAVYKQRLVKGAAHVCDLTGGLGIDSFFLSREARRLTYIERQKDYCEAARRNFASLGAENIDVCEGDARVLLPDLPDSIDVFYIDPARRGGAGKRVFALRECEPDLTALLPELLRRAPRVIARLSPMADLRQTLSLLPGTTQVHVLSVRNECKELLFVIGREAPAAGSLPIHCVHLTREGKEETFTFSLQEEKDCPAPLADAVKTWLYEPNSSILKAGAFRSITRLGICKLHTHSHLYTSGQLLEDFPGRRFAVEEVLPFSSKLRKNLHTSIPRAHISVRNFPLTADELRKRTRIADGGDRYLFATTLHDGTKTLLVCRKHDKP